MELSGEHRIPARREVVWEALHDPELLKDCIRGCQKLDMKDDGTMEAVVQAKVGPVKATFDANVAIVNSVPPESYTLTGEGKGGVAGFANGSADVHLAEDAGETVLTFHAKAKIGGKLAQLGSRLVDTTAKKYASDFFSCLSERLSGDVADVSAAGPNVAAPAVVSGGPAAPAMGGAAANAGAAVNTDVPGRVSPSVAEEGLAEADLAKRNTAIDSPHAEDTAESKLEAEAVRGTWGGPWMWGILAFAVVILILIALS